MKKYSDNRTKIKNSNTIKSVSYSQEEIMKWIMVLYCPYGFDLDPTYSKGNLYKNLPQPKIKADLNPQTHDCQKADCQNLPIENETINSIMFDPPFLGHTPKEINKKGSNIVHRRFGSYNSMKSLWKMYENSLKEFYRILKKQGILVFKCQDIINSRKQYLSHVEIINQALKIGFYPIDLFILISKITLISGKLKKQEHAKKHHCYFIVFKKEKCKVRYSFI